MKVMYAKHCKLTKSKQLELMKYFIAGLTAKTTAELENTHLNTTIIFFPKLREKFA